jgi:hypothetical protein
LQAVAAAGLIVGIGAGIHGLIVPTGQRLTDNRSGTAAILFHDFLEPPVGQEFRARFAARQGDDQQRHGGLKHFHFLIPPCLIQRAAIVGRSNFFILTGPHWFGAGPSLRLLMWH